MSEEKVWVEKASLTAESTRDRYLEGPVKAGPFISSVIAMTDT